MKSLFVILMCCGLCAQEQKDAKKTEPAKEEIKNIYGDLYISEAPYHDWLTKENCRLYKGNICWTDRCAGWHYDNEFCCCDINYDRIKIPLEPAMLVAAGAEPDETAKREMGA